MEFTLLWAALTAVGLGWLGLRIWDDRLPDGAADKLIAAMVIGLAIGRAVAMISQGTNPLAHPGDFIIVRGGVSTVAASAAFLGYLGWATRRQPSALDAMAPAILLGLAGWHLGCLWRGACLGTPSDLPWAWALDGSTITRHPTEIYAALGLALAALIVSRLGWALWLRAGAGLSLAALVRLATEPLRPSLSGGPVLWYAAAILVGVVAIFIGKSRTRKGQPAPST